MQRLAVHQIMDGTELSFSQYEYSRFKYGHRSSCLAFARELALEIIQEHMYNTFASIHTQKGTCRVLVFGAPYNNVETASSYLARETTKILQRYSVALGLDYSFTEGKIKRQHSYAQDYSEMTAEQREVSLTAETYEFIPPVEEIESNYDYILFIDDIYITGSHERRIRALVEKSVITLPHQYVYYAELIEGCCQPSIEHELNSAAFTDEKSLISLIRAWMVKGDFLINTRVTKKLYSCSINGIGQLTKLPLWVKLELQEACLKNTYNSRPEYSTVYDMLENSIRKTLKNLL